MARELQPCGTLGAYFRHRRRGEQPCDPCRRAYNAYQRAYEARTGDDRARHRARIALGRRHPDQLRALLNQQLAGETGETDRRKAYGRARQRALVRLAAAHHDEFAALFAAEKTKAQSKSDNSMEAAMTTNTTTDPVDGYIHAVATALQAAGFTVREARAWLSDWPLEGQIELAGPIAAHSRKSKRYPVLSWHEEYGWDVGLVAPDRLSSGIQGRRHARLGVAPTPDQVVQFYRAWEYMPAAIGYTTGEQYREAEEEHEDTGEIDRIVLAAYAGGGA